MSDIKANPVNLESLQEYTLRELEFIKASWEREKKKLEDELAECQAVLNAISAVEDK